MAAGFSRKVTSTCSALGRKPVLNNDQIFDCQVTHVVDLSEFFVRPTVDGAPCLCSLANSRIKELEMRDKSIQAAKQGKTEDPMDGYYYGYNAMEMPEGLACDSSSHVTTSSLDSENKLSSYLEKGLNYNKLHSLGYIEKVELVAVKVKGKWMRAVVLNVMNDKDCSPICIRVQLLDTGEKLRALPKDVCQLPEMFAKKPAAVITCDVLRF